MEESYKKKYFKYKNKYYNLIKNKTKQKGGNELLTFTLITLILGIIGGSSYIYITNKNTPQGQQEIGRIQNNIDSNIKDFFELAYSIINEKYNHNLYNKLMNYYKYEHVDLTNIKNKTYKLTPDLYINELINLNAKLSSSMPILRLMPIDDTFKQKDSLMFCLKESLTTSYINQKIKNIISTKSSNDIRKELLEHINNNSHFDVYFEEKHDVEKTNINSQDINQQNTNQKNVINKNYTQANKTRFIEFMNKLNNQDIVSDLPMVHAAAELYEVYIILIVNLSNSRYFKFYQPKIKDDTKIPSKENTILLSYFNYCNYQCDFMNNDNIHSLTNNLISNNPITLSTNIINSNNHDNSKITKLNSIDYNGEEKNIVEPELREFNFKFADKKIDNTLDENEIYFYHNKYNNSIDNLNKILHNNNLIHNEKTHINKAINVRPWYQYYNLNVKFLIPTVKNDTFIKSKSQILSPGLDSFN